MYKRQSENLDFKNIYCVGRRTKKLIEQKIGPVKHCSKNSKVLAEQIIDLIEGNNVTYFCGNIRMDDLPRTLEKNNIKVNEIEVYSTKLEAPKLSGNIKGVMFYSPSSINSFLQNNSSNCIAYCIGESTAKEAKKYFQKVYISKIPTIESVIELVQNCFIKDNKND